MKKLVLTIAVMISLTMGAFAQGGGLFQRGGMPNDADAGNPSGPMLPAHGESTNQPANNTPVGSGALLLIGFGAAYAMTKKNKR